MTRKPRYFRAGFRVEMVSGPTSFVSTTRTKAAATALWRLPKGASETGIRLEADEAPLAGDDDA
jgi:hypothetical protein